MKHMRKRHTNARKGKKRIFSRNSQEVTQNMWVHNYSSKKLSLIETNVLAKVLDFAPTPKCILVVKELHQWKMA